MNERDPELIKIENEEPTEGQRIAEEFRQICNKLTREEREELLKKAWEMIYKDKDKDQKKINNNRRPVSVEWSEQDKRFLASINSLPGCMADGKTKEEAISNVRIIEAEWVKTAEELGWDIRAFDE